MKLYQNNFILNPVTAAHRKDICNYLCAELWMNIRITLMKMKICCRETSLKALKIPTVKFLIMLQVA
jgi:hypothetical protein